MKEIPLSQGQIALVDEVDYNWLNQRKWHAIQPDSRYTFYATRTVRMSKGKRKREWMHRVILGLQPSDKRQCHHHDGNGLNNQQSNLRVCTAMQNIQSARKRTGCTSKHKGVFWYQRSRKWCSRIGLNRKRIHLGYFGSETEAAKAYNESALKHFGEFALLNTL